MASYLYILQCEQLFKIGHTNDIKRRIKAMKTGNPFDIKLISLFKFKTKACYVEGELHLKYVDKRIRGEWFALAEADIFSINKEYKEYLVEQKIPVLRESGGYWREAYFSKIKALEMQDKVLMEVMKRNSQLIAQNKMLKQLMLFIER